MTLKKEQDLMEEYKRFWVIIGFKKMISRLPKNKIIVISIKFKLTNFKIYYKIR